MKHKRKNEDFVKRKRKVGVKLKRLNETVLDFRSRSFKSNQTLSQNKSLNLPGETHPDFFAVCLGLTKSHSFNTKKYVLSALNKFSKSKTLEFKLISSTITHLAPLVVDKKEENRSMTRKLMKTVLKGSSNYYSEDNKEELKNSLELFVVHLKTAITSLLPEVRLDAINFTVDFINVLPGDKMFNLIDPKSFLPFMVKIFNDFVASESIKSSLKSATLMTTSSNILKGILNLLNNKELWQSFNSPQQITQLIKTSSSLAILWSIKTTAKTDFQKTKRSQTLFLICQTFNTIFEIILSTKFKITNDCGPLKMIAAHFCSSLMEFKPKENGKEETIKSDEFRLYFKIANATLCCEELIDSFNVKGFDRTTKSENAFLRRKIQNFRMDFKEFIAKNVFLDFKNTNSDGIKTLKETIEKMPKSHLANRLILNGINDAMTDQFQLDRISVNLQKSVRFAIRKSKMSENSFGNQLMVQSINIWGEMAIRYCADFLRGDLDETSPFNQYLFFSLGLIGDILSVLNKNNNKKSENCRKRPEIKEFLAKIDDLIVLLSKNFRFVFEKTKNDLSQLTIKILFEFKNFSEKSLKVLSSSIIANESADCDFIQSIILAVLEDAKETETKNLLSFAFKTIFSVDYFNLDPSKPVLGKETEDAISKVRREFTTGSTESALNFHSKVFEALKKFLDFPVFFECADFISVNLKILKGIFVKFSFARSQESVRFLTVTLRFVNFCLDSLKSHEVTNLISDERILDLAVNLNCVMWRVYCANVSESNTNKNETKTAVLDILSEEKGEMNEVVESCLKIWRGWPILVKFLLNDFEGRDHCGSRGFCDWEYSSEAIAFFKQEEYLRDIIKE